MTYKKKWTASEILGAKYKGEKNMFTPNKIKVGKINPDVAYELSKGKSIFRDNGDLYGVSVVAVNKKKWSTRGLYDLSGAFGSKNEAEAHINRLKKIMRKLK